MARYRLGFVMEQTLGHVTHARNLRPRLDAARDIDAVWMPVPFDADDRWQRHPLTRGNWTLRASLRARDLVREASAAAPLDAVFYHTQTTALLAGGAASRGAPYVVSLDATPRNIDRLAAAYAHRPSRLPLVERGKDALMGRVLRRAAHLTTWCAWARQSLVEDYGVPADMVTVVPPGVDLALWAVERGDARPAGPARLLFVGGDFERKGGPLLLDAFRALPPGAAEMDVVTRERPNGAEIPGVRVHTGLGPNDPALMRLFAEATIFVLPTLGDVLPVVCIEAMAAGLPVVASGVGAIDEEVLHGETGLLFEPGDGRALRDALCTLTGDPVAARRMGAAGRRRAEALFDAERNYAAIIGICRDRSRGVRT